VGRVGVGGIRRRVVLGTKADPINLCGKVAEKKEKVSEMHLKDKSGH